MADSQNFSYASGAPTSQLKDFTYTTSRGASGRVTAGSPAEAWQLASRIDGNVNAIDGVSTKLIDPYVPPSQAVKTTLNTPTADPVAKTVVNATNTPTPATPATPVPQATAQPNASTPVGGAAPATTAAPVVSGGSAQTSLVPPHINLQPGSTGGDVSALQAYLKSKGLLTDAQIATGPGIYGPATTAAVAKLQQQLGVDAGGNAGFYGPKTQSAIAGQSTATPPGTTTDPGTQAPAPAATPTPGKTAVQTVIDDYTSAYTALGLGDIKKQYTDYVQKQTDITNKINAEKADVDNNPWLSESVRARTKDQIDNKYKTQVDTLTHQVSLLDSMYKEGQLEVNNIVTKAEAIDLEQMREAAAIAKQKQDAIDALTLAKAKESPTDKYGTGSIGEYNFAKSQGYTGSFTQYQNEDANRKARAAGSGSATPKTLEERKAQSLSDLQAAIDSSPKGAGITDPNGYLTTASLKKMISAAPSQGLNGNDVISQVGNSLAPNFDKKGNAIPNTVSDAYGLTVAQKKLLGITP